ncbi:MAG: glycosyltransferase family 2 protein [Bacteroides sp.]|nr:glycosyltransferase family 2 protein [Roseburia sp.]MCM1345948.1 glycosyltransferase family 2 protein [Bacteroides sp.]MCM1420312.1 glycosyltransferase family 2 protein [Bacteroides sp.]
MKLSVVIVNYNVRFYLEQCLYSVAKASEGISHEIFVVDNNSTDGSAAYIRSRFPEVVYIENDENVGFARANNQAIRRASGEYVLLLNPDTILGEDMLRDCIAFMDSHGDAGAAGVRMLRNDGSFALESRRGIPTPFTSLCKMSGLCSLFPKSRLFGRYYMQYLDDASITPIEIISGACMFIRTETLRKSGLLDEAFFMYGEDIDLSYRLMQTGKSNYYIPTRILHYKGESTEKSSYRHVYVFYQAMLIFFRKHYGHYSFLLSLPIKMAIYFKAFCTYVTRQVKKRVESKENSLEYMQKRKYLLVGTEESVCRMKHVASGYRLDCQCVVADANFLKSGHSSSPELYAGYDYIVYDTDLFSFKDIFRFFEKSSDWSIPPMIATYLSANHCIVTGNYVFEER